MPDHAPQKYTRILLKLSGEVLAGEERFGIDAERVKALAAEVASVAQAGVQVGVVVGGGNFFRGPYQRDGGWTLAADRARP